jgi:hypothetical protein
MACLVKIEHQLGPVDVLINNVGGYLIRTGDYFSRDNNLLISQLDRPLHMESFTKFWCMIEFNFKAVSNSPCSDSNFGLLSGYCKGSPYYGYTFSLIPFGNEKRHDHQHYIPARYSAISFLCQLRCCQVCPNPCHKLYTTGIRLGQT